MAIGIDNSLSILKSSKDSTSLKNDVNGYLTSVKDNFEKDYNIKTFYFDASSTDTTQLNFKGKRSSIASFYNNLADRYGNNGVDVSMLLSDGISNSGENPELSSQKLSSKNYTIGLGDTAINRDAIVSDVLHNTIAYSGNTIPIKTRIRSLKLKNQTGKLSISENGKVLFSSDYLVKDDNNFIEVDANIPIEGKGRKQFLINISKFDDEITYNNNSKKIAIDVIDVKKKVLIIAQAPNPDISALQKSLQRGEKYETDLILEYELSNRKIEEQLINKYQLVIFHGFSGSANVINLHKKIADKNISSWYIYTPSTNLVAFNNLNTGVRINTLSENQNLSFQEKALNDVRSRIQDMKSLFAKTETNNVLPTINKDFLSFNIPEKLNQTLSIFPPLQVAFADFPLDKNTSVLFNQKIGNVVTDKPLWVFNNSQDRRISILLGEGLWRWFFAEYQATQSNSVSDELISKTVQLLATIEDKRPFKVKSLKDNYLDDENIEFEAELYNKAYEPISNATITLQVFNQNYNKISYTFLPNGSKYSLNIGSLPKGAYTYTALTNFEGKKLSISGKFIVEENFLEYADLTADHNLLRKIAKNSDAEFSNFNEVDKIINTIKSQEKPTQIAYSQINYKDFIELKYLFFIWFVLLGMEWFLRKYFGSY